MRASSGNVALGRPRFCSGASAQRGRATPVGCRRADSGGLRNGSAKHWGLLAGKHGPFRTPVPRILRSFAAARVAKRRTVRTRSDQHPLPGFCAPKPAQRPGGGMNWLALSPVEVAAVWSALAALALWLYLHHRRPQHRRVSTLRFWASVQPVAQPRRRRLREPWALLAQVLFLLLLILALANPRWGVTFEGRSVVIVLDTSIWSQMRPAGASPWIDKERQEAQRVLDSLPVGDRVLLLPAEADAPPILPFTTDRGALRRAISEAPTSSSNADIPRALEMGKAALGGSRRGLLVYVGPGMVDERQAHALDEFRSATENPDDNRGQPQFLVRLVGGETPVQNRGITRLSLRRDAAQPDRWRLLTQLKNYSDTKTNVVLKLSVSGQPLGQRTISMSPGELTNAENEFTWEKGGLLQAEISPSDALEADNRAVVNLPTFRVIRVAVFTGNSTFPAYLLT